jgi:uncharacterized protein YjbI with pentapeptide repeats
MPTPPPNTVAPRRAAVKIGPVSAVSMAEFTDPDGNDLENVELVGERFDELHWGGRRRLDASRLHELVIGRWRARAVVVSDSVLSQLDMVAFAAPESGWREVVVRDSRIGAAEFHQANLRRVEFTGCKFGYLNLRDADLADITFTDCQIEDLDLLRAQAKRVSLPGCRIQHLEVGHSKLADFDLRGAAFGDVSGLEGLRGVTVSADQLFDLAPIMAARLGLMVE